MKSLVLASAALLLAGTALSSAASAQTAGMSQTTMGPAATSYSPYEGNSPGYPQGQPVPPASKPYYSPAPMAGSGMAAQTYGTAPGAYGSSEMMSSAQSSAPGYPQGQPVSPASKPYYSPTPQVGSSMAPQSYGSSFGGANASGYPYTPGSPYIAPYTSVPGNSAFDSPPGYPAGQPVSPANKPYHSQP